MAGQDKTEKATPQRLREARKRGDVPMSPELTGSIAALVSLFILQQQGSHILDGLLGLLSRDLAQAGHSGTMTAASAGAQIQSDVASGLLLLLPLVAAVFVGGLAAGLLNTRGLLSFTPLKPSMRKLNPLHNVKRLFSKDTLVQLGKTLIKLAIVVVVVQMWAPSWRNLMPGASTGSMAGAIGTVWQDSLQVAIQISAAFAVTGAIDFGYRYYAWFRRMRMTKQEVKEEFKRSEGNPQMRARMRNAARKRLKSLIGGSGLRRVPQADVVITNPTHFAVAVQYKAGSMRAPKVIAKGQRLVALRIKEAARTHHIPIVENKPLAQALFKSVEVNQEIPADLYQAVAQVLAFVYRMRGPARAARAATASTGPRQGQTRRAS